MSLVDSNVNVPMVHINSFFKQIYNYSSLWQGMVKYKFKYYLRVKPYMTVNIWKKRKKVSKMCIFYDIEVLLTVNEGYQYALSTFENQTAPVQFMDENTKLNFVGTWSRSDTRSEFNLRSLSSYRDTIETIKQCVQSGETLAFTDCKHLIVSAVPKTQERCKYVPDFMECLFQNEQLQFFWRNQGEGELSAFSLAVLSNLNFNLTFTYIPGLDNYNYVQLRYQEGRPADLFYDHYPRSLRQYGEETVPFVVSRPVFTKTGGREACDIYNMFSISYTSLTCDKKSNKYGFYSSNHSVKNDKWSSKEMLTKQFKTINCDENLKKRHKKCFH